MMLQQRVYLSDLMGQLIDLRGHRDAEPLLTPDSWSAGQALGRNAWEQQADGIVYPSVRDPDGECAAVLRPRYSPPRGKAVISVMIGTVSAFGTFMS